MGRNVVLSNPVSCRIAGKRYREAALYIANVAAYIQVLGPDQGLAVECSDRALDEQDRWLLR